MVKLLKIRKIKNYFFTFVLLLGCNLSFAQVLSLQATNESNVKISGTSSLHDWLMESPVENCNIVIANWPEDNSFELKKVVFQLAVPQLKSEHKKMDNNAFKALKSKEFPNIRFESNPLQIIAVNNEGLPSVVKGTLEIAGVSKEIELSVITKINDKTGLLFQFAFPIHMEDYAVEPPSFMFGAVTTGSDVLASFELYFNKLNQ